LLPTLGDAIHIYTKLARLDEARQLGRELVAAHPRAAVWSTDFMIVADRLGFAADMRQATANIPKEHPAYALTLAIAEGRLMDAIAIAVEGRSTSFAAEVRVVTARALLEEGRAGEACAQLEHALTFYRSVRATRFIREAEALLETARAAAARP
jgi:hypothetical protein